MLKKRFEKNGLGQSWKTTEGVYQVFLGFRRMLEWARPRMLKQMFRVRLFCLQKRVLGFAAPSWGFRSRCLRLPASLPWIQKSELLTLATRVTTSSPLRWLRQLSNMVGYCLELVQAFQISYVMISYSDFLCSLCLFNEVVKRKMRREYTTLRGRRWGRRGRGGAEAAQW